jgi:ammonium transporter, Amt family
MVRMRGKKLALTAFLGAFASQVFAQSAGEPGIATAPYLVDADQISSGDTAWMLTSTALVLLMTLPGLALFYGGMVRKKNLLSTMAQSFAIACLVTVLWVVIGYSLAFTEDSPWLGGTTRFALEGLFYAKGGQVSVSHLAPSIPESVYMMFQLMFAIITPALITGAFAERIKFSSMLVFMALWSLCVYVPMAHWVWSPDGWLASLGVLDFAGGTVVHINAGVTGLACVIMLGERKGYGTDPIFPHNLALTITGAALLWVGWFGFNAGSALAADGRAGLAFATTHCAAATAALTWMAIEWAARGKASVLGIASGAVAGLVAITPAAGYVGIGPALVIGVAASLACFGAVVGLKSWFGYDDSLDAFGIHAVGGIVGAVLTGVFASVAIGGVEGSITAQLIGIGACAAYALVVSLILLMLISVTIGLRVSEEAEAAGLDVSTHGESVE